MSDARCYKDATPTGFPGGDSGKGLNTSGKFVVAVPQRTNYYNAYAETLAESGLLRFYALGTRRGHAGVPAELTRLKPVIGLLSYAADRTLGTFAGESLRFRLLPWFDRWVRKQLQPGDHIISSFGYANGSFEYARKNGGKTFVEAGNSHIENFWSILSEEQRRWKSKYPPVSRFWYERSRAMLSEGVDYVLSPSSYVTNSFLERGFRQEQIIKSVFPLDLSVFRPSAQPRPKDRPLTVINTGTLSLRKGTPYLLEGFRLLCERHPGSRLLLTEVIRDDVEPVLVRYRDLPIEWAPSLPPDKLAERLQTADVFVLPSLEEGLVRTAMEAMACGLQVVLTPNTGASDFVTPGVNGEIVPIREPKAIANGILKCWERVLSGRRMEVADLKPRVSLDTFKTNFLRNLERIGFSAQLADQRGMP